MTDNQFAQFVLLCLRQVGDREMPDAALKSAVRVMSQENLTNTNLDERLRRLEEQNLIMGVDNVVLGRFWGLTTHGRQIANQL